MQQDARIFEFEIDAEPTATIDYGVKTIKFGDGYEQRQATRLGRPLESWKVKHTGDIFDISQIKYFLDDHRGLTPFKWIDPFGVQRLIVVNEFDVQQVDGRVWRVEFEMREVRE